MTQTAQDVFNASLLKVGVIGGGVCLLVLVVFVAVAVILVANSKKRDE